MPPRIAESLHAVAPAGDDLVEAHQYRANRHFSRDQRGLRFFEREAHAMHVVLMFSMP